MKKIFYNGIVYTGALPLQEAFIVENAAFTFVGSTADALMQQTSEDEVIDLQGQFVCAGFNDSHMHLLEFGKMLNLARLDLHTRSLADLLQCMKDFAAEHPVSEGGWLIGRGFNHDYFSDVHRLPNRYDLDQVSEEYPVMVIRTCGHCLAVNSKALELLGITSDTPAVDGGEIGMTDGQPNGLFFENAMDLVYHTLPTPGKAELKAMIKAACRELNSYGVTSSQTDDYCVYPNLSWKTLNEVYQELEAEGELTVRVNEQCNFYDLDAFKEFVEAGNVTGTGSDFFRIGPLKLIGDGSLGANTAFLSIPYQDNPGTCGMPVFSKEELTRRIHYAHNAGVQVAVHAIGDQTAEWILDACESALAENPRPDHRHGIVHCQITRPEQLDRMARLGMHIYAQSIFLDYDIHIVEEHAGKELASSSYSWKTLLDKGATVSNGSDCPVELPKVLAGIQCAVTRKTLSGELGPYLPKEAFTVSEAIDSYTIAGAYASFEENVKGRIRSGMLADFTVLGENPFTAEPTQIKDIPVKAVYLGGKKVY